MSPWRAIPLALLLAVLVRVPFWIEALHTPVDGDTAIVGLMARHPGEGTTLWGQPYGSPLDAWVATPFVAILGSSVEALRLPSFLLSLLLVVLVPTRSPASSTPPPDCPPPCWSRVPRPTSCCSRRCRRPSMRRPSCCAVSCCSAPRAAGRRLADA